MMENHYYNEALDLDGTAEVLYNHVSHGYITDPEAVKAVWDILKSEGKDDMARYVGYIYEEVTDDGKEPYNFGVIKQDIWRGISPEEVILRDGLMMTIQNEPRFQQVIIYLEEWDENDERRSGGIFVGTEDFLKLSASEFREKVNAIHFYCMEPDEEIA